MRVLLDTHVLIWWTREPAKLSPRVGALFQDGSTELLWSPASTWEMAIKMRTGRLKLKTDLTTFLSKVMVEQDIRPLPIQHPHAARVTDLPDHHKDPFDRLLVAQAMLEGVPLVSIDEVLDDYPVERLW